MPLDSPNHSRIPVKPLNFNQKREPGIPILKSTKLRIETEKRKRAPSNEIDDFLKEVEQIKLSSPAKKSDVAMKRELFESSEGSSIDSSVSTSTHPATSSSIESITKEDIRKCLDNNKNNIKDYNDNNNNNNKKKNSNNNNEIGNDDLSSSSESTPKIPKSISQALFSKSALKVTKVHEKSAVPKFIGIKPPESPQDTQKMESLQRKEKHLNRKIKKLESEIEYLNNLIDNAGITSDLNEMRKVKSAIDKLQSYLDQVFKEKYEIGTLITRAVRKKIDSGEGGEFWVN